MQEDNKMAEEAEDYVKEKLLLSAESCLDHIRKVKWGSAVAAYAIDDGDYNLDVHVEVKCSRKKMNKDS